MAGEGVPVLQPAGPGRQAGPAPAPAEGLRLHLLGPFRVWAGPAAVDESAWRRRKAAALLQLLALAPGHRLHQQQVIEHLWPDAAPEAALRSCYTAVYFLRRSLAPDAAGPPGTALLQLGDQHLHLCPETPLWTDVEAFEATAAAAQRRSEPAAYQAALALYGGDLLPEEPYADWAAARRETLRETYLTLLMKLAGLHEAAGQHVDAIEALQRVVVYERAHEAAHAGLMRLYAETGQRPQALRQYQQLREALQRDLDAAPESATQRLYRAIFTGEFTPRRPTSAAETAPAETAAAPAVAAGRPAPPARRRHNLPHQLTTFIGREPALATVEEMLATGRLVTLTGAGGSGKTRLAVEVATRSAQGEMYAGGICLVELGALGRGELVSQAIATALGVREQTGRPLLDTIGAAIGARTLLLVLDNCEQLIEPCAQLADRLLRSCPGLRLLTTSRQALGVLGEAVFPVPPLTLPPPGAVSPAAPETAALTDLATSEAGQLFLDRARLAHPGFALTGHNAPAVGEICRRLDGLPLAIELAAARVRLLGVETIAARLGDRFRLLTGGNRAAPPRHQTLRAAIEWSYALLSAPERALFERLAVFAGGFTLEAVEAIAGDRCDAGDGGWVIGVGGTGEAASSSPNTQHPTPIAEHEVLDLLGRLVDKSLVVVEAGGAADEAGAGAVRYRLLETLREYAQERLVADRGPEGAGWGALRQRHAGYFLRLAEAAEAQLTGAEQRRWLAQLEAEHDNLRAALAWAQSDASTTEVGLRLAGALWRFWWVHGHLSEGRRWLEAMLGRTGEAVSSSRGVALSGAGILAHFQGDFEQARQFHETSLALRRALGDKMGIAGSLNNLGMVASSQGDYERAAAFYEESRALKQALGDTWGVAAALNNLGVVTCSQGDYERARAFYEQGLALHRELGDQAGIATSLNNLGLVAYHQGDYERARALYEESLTLKQALGDKRGIAYTLNTLGLVAYHQGDSDRAWHLHRASLALRQELGDKRGIADSLEGVAGAAGALGQPAAAARLFGAAEALREQLGVPLPPPERLVWERQVAVACAQLEAAAFGAAWAAGRLLPPEEAIAEAQRAMAAATDA